MASFVRGSVVIVQLPHVGGAEKAGTRPCVVVQNDHGNSNTSWPLTIVVPVTTRPPKYPLDVPVKSPDGGLIQDSTADCSQILTIDKSKITKTVGKISTDTMVAIEKAIKITLDLS